MTYTTHTTLSLELMLVLALSCKDILNVKKLKTYQMAEVKALKKRANIKQIIQGTQFKLNTKYVMQWSMSCINNKCLLTPMQFSFFSGFSTKYQLDD